MQMHRSAFPGTLWRAASARVSEGAGPLFPERAEAAGLGPSWPKRGMTLAIASLICIN